MKPLTCHALCSSGELTSAATDIQWAPPGVHVITPKLEGKEAQPIKIRVDAKLAGEIEAQRAAMQAAADAGNGAHPFFDFNHEDAAASAWPRQFYWGGEDPITGGVRCKIDWTDAGTAAIDGKTYRRFSPGLSLQLVAKDDGKKELAKDAEGFHVIAGTGANMGGLVNRPAFQTIAAFFSSAVEEQTETEPPPPPMNEEEIKALQDQLAAALAEIETLKKANAAMEADMQAKCRADAKETIAAAAKEGRIPAAEEVQAIWVDKLVADPEGTAKLLAAQAPSEALQPFPFKAAPEAAGTQAATAKSGIAGLAEIIKAKQAAQ